MAVFAADVFEPGIFEDPTPQDVAAVLIRAPRDAPYAYEGPLRHALRRRWCLAGRAWRDAEIRAAELVEMARRMNGTPKPVGWDWGKVA